VTAVSTTDGRPATTSAPQPGAAAVAIIPGLLLAVAIALAAGAISGVIPATVPAVTITILLGIAVGQVAVRRSESLAPGLEFTAKRILRLGIVLIGARLSFEQIARIGIPAALIVVVTMVAALALVLGLSRLAKLEPRLAVLLAVGAAVCGNSAVVATAPVIGARPRDVAFAVATVTVFGTAAVFIYPLIGHAVPLGDVAFGLWSGIAVNDTSQVVAASAAFSPQALDVATVVKLIRNALMAPLLLGIAWAWVRSGSVAGETRVGLRKAVPIFVLGFVAMTVLRSVGIIGPELAQVLTSASGWCILIGLAGVGLTIRLSELRAIGPQAFAVGLGAAVVIGLATLLAIVSFDLGSSLPA
jgi:uncharacterized integral membrane protein (TIGR00698 family)